MSKWYDSILMREFRRRRQQVRNFCVDLIESLTVKKEKFNEFNPPKKLRRLVGGEKDFDQVGKEFLKYFIDYCQLKSNWRILEVGCGIGRIACFLTKNLDQRGSYEGFDIVREAIEWDNKTLASKFPNFHFQLADIYNKCYNPKGKFKASEYKFPYESESFDFVFLTSVFTHMLPKDVGNYLLEIARVLKPNSMCFATFFILNEESIRLVNSKVSSFNFQYEYDGYRTQSEIFPESAIAFDEKLILELYQRSGLHVREPIHYGGWSGRKDHLSGQDIIIADKTSKN